LRAQCWKLAVRNVSEHIQTQLGLSKIVTLLLTTSV